VHVISSARTSSGARADNRTLSSAGQSAYARANSSADANALRRFTLAGFRIVAPSPMPGCIR
jgi:hypothetical protein